MYMYFGFDFFQIGNHTKNDCPRSIISCPFLSVGCNTKVCLLHFLNQSLFILLIILLFSVLLFEQTPGGRGLVLPIVPFVGSLHFTPSTRGNIPPEEIGYATLVSKESAEIGRCFVLPRSSKQRRCTSPVIKYCLQKERECVLAG